MKITRLSLIYPHKLYIEGKTSNPKVIKQLNLPCKGLAKNLKKETLQIYKHSPGTNVKAYTSHVMAR